MAGGSSHRGRTLPSKRVNVVPAQTLHGQVGDPEGGQGTGQDSFPVLEAPRGHWSVPTGIPLAPDFCAGFPVWLSDHTQVRVLAT